MRDQLDFKEIIAKLYQTLPSDIGTLDDFINLEISSTSDSILCLSKLDEDVSISFQARRRLDHRAYAASALIDPTV